MANIITNNDVCAIGDIDDVIQLECYFDGHTSLQPFMHDIDFTQNPTLVNANHWMYNTYAPNLHDDIADLFGPIWKDKRYRWWDGYSSEEEGKNNKREYI